MASVSFDQPARASRHTAVPEVHAVQLERLPDRLQFPVTLADRIWFDREQKRLSFRGFMSKATYDQLDALSDDNAYQRAIEELFRQSVYHEPISQRRPLRGLLPIVALLMTTGLVAVALTIPIRLLVAR